MGILSTISLGISAISGREKSTPALWYIWWILGGAVAQIAERTQPWLRHISFNYNLEQSALPSSASAMTLAPPGTMSRSSRNAAQYSPANDDRLERPALVGAVAASLIMMGLAALIIHKRVKPE